MEHRIEGEELTTNYSFLSHHNVRAYFADVNISLLSGRHIQAGEGYLFSLLSSYPDEFRNFYRSLYGLELHKGRMESTEYFYLDFPQEGKGKLNTSERFREMSHWEMLIGFMLLNLYYDRMFEMTKTIDWSVLVKEIAESDLSGHYRKVFFNNANRDHYTDAEWKTVRENFKRVLRTFDRWGWVKLATSEGGDDEPVFVIRDSIDQFGKLYHYEISQFDHFVEQVNKKRKA
ncbi:MAG: condensin complex protein MksE [Bacteroidia bacterium]